MTEEATTVDSKVETVKVDALRETTVAMTTEVVAIGIVRNVKTQTLLSELNVTDVEKHAGVAVEAITVAEMTEEAMIVDSKVETGKVDALREMTAAMMTGVVAIGIVQNAETRTLLLEPNVTDVENHEVQAVETIAAVEMTEEAMMADSKVETDKVDALRETTVKEIIEQEEAIGIVQNVETQTLLSEPSAISVDYHEVVVEMTVDVVETTVDVVETTVDVVEKPTMITTGTVQSAAIQTSRLEQNVTAVEHLALVVDVEDVTAMMVEDLLVVMIGLEHLVVMMVEDPLDVTMVEDPRVVTMAEDPLEAMMVEDLLDVTMVEEPLDVMDETDEMKAVVKVVVHTVKIDLNVSQENLEHLENLVEMAQAMPITEIQSQSVDLEMTTREGKQWVPNITTLTP